jgi:CBS domain-containing protein
MSAAADLLDKYGLTPQWVVDQAGRDVIAIPAHDVLAFLKRIEQEVR